MPGGEDVLVVVDEDDKFEVLVLSPSSFVSLLARLELPVGQQRGFLLKRRGLFQFDAVERLVGVGEAIECSINEGHSYIELLLIKKGV